jgi:hypothetical protein
MDFVSVRGDNPKGMLLPCLVAALERAQSDVQTNRLPAGGREKCQPNQ